MHRMAWLKAAARTLWSRILGPRLDERFAGRIRKEQLAAILRLTPAMMLANLANGSMLLYAFWAGGPRWFLVVWFAALCMTAALGLRAWLRSRKRQPPLTVSTRGIRRAVWHGFTLGAVWAVIPVILFADADGPQRVLLAALMTGMIAGGGFALSTVPPAALAYASVMILSSMAVLLATGEPIYLMVAALLLTYSLIVGRSIFWHADLFAERLDSQFDLEHQRELIGILLRDFEESASDWLWEIDADGRLQHVSHRLADVMGQDETVLQGRRLVDLFSPVDRRPSTGNDQGQVADLLACLERRSSFRDCTIDVMIGDEQRSWSLSAKPVYDVQGTFKGYRGVGTDVTDKILAERKLAYLAHTDPLTDLANRSCLDSGLTDAFGELETLGQGFGIVCLDLDGFKAVNDTFGHGAGDRLLAIVGRRLKRCARSGDIVARVGGDEFAVLQKATDQPDAGMALAKRIVTTLAAPFDLEGQRVALGASVGVAIADWDGDDPKTLMKHADQALYCAKRRGRGRCVRYRPGMAKEAQALPPLGRDLTGALACSDMERCQQPIPLADSSDVVAIDASPARQHRMLGLVPAATFPPVAEETGRIADLAALPPIVPAESRNDGQATLAARSTRRRRS